MRETFSVPCEWLDALPSKGSFDGDGGACEGARGWVWGVKRVTTETGMEQGMWVYMAAAVGAE